MNPEQILAAVARVYAECRSYHDTGTVITRFIKPNGSDSHTSIRPFQTAFMRPDRFRFEFRNRYQEEAEWTRYIVWSHGPDVRTLWDPSPEAEQEESLGLAIAGATGVSGGSAHTIPSLLMREQIGGLYLSDMVEVTSLDDEAVEGVVCYRLSGRLDPSANDPVEQERRRKETFDLIGWAPGRSEQSPTTVWIRRETLLIRRLEEKTQFETFRTESATTYAPEMNGLVPESDLQLDRRAISQG